MRIYPFAIPGSNTMAKNGKFVVCQSPGSMAIKGIAAGRKKQHRVIYALLHAILNIIIAKMKNPDRKTVSQLEELPSIGKAITGDLRLVGIQQPQDSGCFLYPYVLG